MQYRKLPHGGESISLLGMGSSAIGQAGEKEIQATVSLALEQGINYFDMASADAAPFAAYGRAVAQSGLRRQVYFQIHFGADYSSGKYGWTLDLDTIRRSVDWQLTQLQTDYIDFAFLHCMDEAEDYDRAAGTVAYMQELKRQGVVRHLGMSSHTPEVAQRALDDGLLDMLMFSINPAYDCQKGEYGLGAASQRMALYRRCQAQGVGISVMKAFAAGQLLDARLSPFGVALTRYQCLQYALDRPGVLTVLPGVRNREDLRQLLGFFDAPAEERDYSVLGSLVPPTAAGVCTYCNHCQPCPMGLDIGLINKYYDLARAGDPLAADHYRNLSRHASLCAACGHCDSRCPFQVHQMQRMQEIAAYFGD